MFNWFKKQTAEKAYSRRQFLRGGFIREALNDAVPAQDSAVPPAGGHAVGEGAEPAAAHEPLDLLSFLAAADPTAAEREAPPGVGRLENHPSRRGQMPILRPPGAVAEADFLSLCTRCDDCMSACPHGAIQLAPARFRDAAGTPMIDAFDAPCHMCADAPCISACQTGALDATLPKRMGLAHLQTYNCLAHNRGFCSTCVERCPVDGAIELREGKPYIVDATCSGCGVCHSVCPAPMNAIMIMPVPNRPPAPALEAP